MSMPRSHFAAACSQANPDAEGVYACWACALEHTALPARIAAEATLWVMSQDSGGGWRICLLNNDMHPVGRYTRGSEPFGEDAP